MGIGKAGRGVEVGIKELITKVPLLVLVKVKGFQRNEKVRCFGHFEYYILPRD